MIGLVVVREGRLPAGADAAVAECDGRTILVGEGTRAAAAHLGGAREVRCWEAGPFAPARWVEGLARLVGDEVGVVLPGSPDGRDLAGRLAAATGRRCHAWCTSVTATTVVTTRHDGTASVTTPIDGPFVATLVPRAHASRTAPATGAGPEVLDVALDVTDARDAQVDGVDDVDPAEVDLAEADRIVAGGLGLGGPDAFGVLAVVAASLGASLGATRPVADRGIVAHERQIGTTGVTVDPSLYVALGISGAVQHTAGLGARAKVIAVNTDPACPMMSMADLAIVADAPATLHALARRLGTPR